MQTPHQRKKNGGYVFVYVLLVATIAVTASTAYLVQNQYTREAAAKNLVTQANSAGIYQMENNLRGRLIATIRNNAPITETIVTDTTDLPKIKLEGGDFTGLAITLDPGSEPLFPFTLDHQGLTLTDIPNASACKDLQARNVEVKAFLQSTPLGDYNTAFFTGNNRLWRQMQADLELTFSEIPVNQFHLFQGSSTNTQGGVTINQPAPSGYGLIHSNRNVKVLPGVNTTATHVTSRGSIDATSASLNGFTNITTNLSNWKIVGPENHPTLITAEIKPTELATPGTLSTIVDVMKTQCTGADGDIITWNRTAPAPAHTRNDYTYATPIPGITDYLVIDYTEYNAAKPNVSKLAVTLTGTPHTGAVVLTNFNTLNQDISIVSDNWIIVQGDFNATGPTKKTSLITPLKILAVPPGWATPPP
jgi:hypothetical protein